MKIAIIGAGAMGCLFASYLNESHHVTLIDHWQAQIDHIRTHGLRREREGVVHLSHPSATTNPAEAQGADVCIVMVKYHQTAWAANLAEIALAPDGLCITMQNGIGGAAVLGQILGQSRVAQGVTALGATIVEIGAIKHAGMGESVFAANHPSPYLNQLVSAFNQAGLPAHQQTNLETLIWGKLIVNAGINALTAILRVRNGELDAHPDARQLLSEVVKEAVMVAHAHNITLPYADPVAHVLAVARATSANRSSTLQDILRGSPSEIPTINGAIVAAAEAVGIATPYNRMLAQLMCIIDSCDHSF